MRRVLVAWVLLAACGSSAPKGPAWPAPAESDEDGGEPLDPRPSAKYAAAVEKSADREPEKGKDKEKPAAEEPAARSDTSATSSEATPEPTETADDDLPITEEIVIEIDGE